MKNVKFIAALLVIFAVFSFKQEPDKSLARVNRIQGVYVFVQCQPVQDYEVVDDLSTTLTSFAVGKQSIDDQLSEMIKRARNKIEKGKMEEFDGIITEDGNTGTFIKFK